MLIQDTYTDLCAKFEAYMSYIYFLYIYNYICISEENNKNNSFATKSACIKLQKHANNMLICYFQL